MQPVLPQLWGQQKSRFILVSMPLQKSLGIFWPSIISFDDLIELTGSFHPSVQVNEREWIKRWSCHVSAT